MKRFLSFSLSLVLALGATFSTAYAKEIVNVDINKDNISHSVSEDLYGLSLGDTAYSCDGGLVAQLVNNGSFEYSENMAPAWDLAGKASISATESMNEKNPQYAVIHADNEKIEIQNYGYADIYSSNKQKYNEKTATAPSMKFENGKSYDFSCYVKNNGFEGIIGVYLNSKGNSRNIIQLADSNIPSSQWTELKAVLKSDADSLGSLSLVFDGTGDILLDSVTLVPQDSYGYTSDEWKYTFLRADLVHSIKELNPSFVRFPAGETASGASLDDMFCWKDTIGSLDSRKQHKSVYTNEENGNYFNNSCQMGYHEYFQLCEDLGANPVPVVGAGIASQVMNKYDLYYDASIRSSFSDEEWEAYLANKSIDNVDDYNAMIDSLGVNSPADFDRFIQRIALDPKSNEFTNYVQDILDLIEYANGDSITTYWGALRAMNGHEQPFGMKYICVGAGNYGDTYKRNFDAIKSAINKAYPDIKVVSCDSGVDSDIVDYPQNIDNGVNGFDGFDCDDSKVSLKLSDFSKCNSIQNNDLTSAIEEAENMIGCERNGDVVSMISYDNALARGSCADSFDSLIWFDLDDIAYSASYYVQEIFANNTGNKYINTSLGVDGVSQSVTIDEGKQVIYVKLANSTSSAKDINLNISGFGEVNSVSNVYISHKFGDAYNRIGKQTVAPQVDEIGVSDNNAKVRVDANSVNVIRIAYGDNNGANLWVLPDGYDYDTSLFVSNGMKLFVVVFILVFTISMAGGFLLYTRVINKNANPKRIKKREID